MAVIPNQKFNALTAIKRIGHVKHGRNNVGIWLCQCDCGNTLEVDQVSLVKGIVPACKTCRRGPCVVCGSKITNDDFSVKRNTCSDICKKEAKRIKDRKYYAKRLFENPEHNKLRHQQRVMDNPEYSKNKYRAFRKKLNSLPSDERKIIINKLNEYSNRWRKEWKKNATPEQLESFLIAQRKSYRKHQTSKALAQLMKTDLAGK